MDEAQPDKNAIDLTLAAFRDAQERISSLATRTPLIRLQSDHRANIYLKLESLQPIGSFKIRCAANALLRRQSIAHRGIYTASAGNFAQGLAYVARELGHHVQTIVPDTAAASKLDALRRLGAEIVTAPYAEWWDLLENPNDDPLFIHPVRDPDVIVGNGSIGLEILADLPTARYILAPYGGGGLSSGIAAAIKAAGSAANVLACETEAGAPLTAALAAGTPTEIAFDAGTFVTGMGAPIVIPTMWPLVSSLIADTIVVTLEETAAAIRLLVARHHIIAEGAGAVPVAAALKGELEGPIVCIVSGGHLDRHHLMAILRGEMP